MVFFENHLLARPFVPGTTFTTPVFTTLDTGASTTDLNSNFALQFPKFIERTGKKGRTEVAALGGRCCVGNLGLDLLRQTGDLTIDFRTMTLRLR
jgi:hypothetical protein